eukprot:Hpha_TRINITY_DN6574_c0_g1::TRINITY_DN6574_c0_g1_i2::g.45971::m.45971
MTKPLTCVAAMILYERGCFHLLDPVSRWLPEWCHTRMRVWRDGAPEGEEPVQRPVTVKHLLTHTSGIVQAIPGTPGSPAADEWNRTVHGSSPTSLEQLASLAAQVPLVAQPGEKWVYGDGLSVLARLIEIWSGKSFEEFLKDEVTDPLGMHDTTYRWSQRQRLVDCYVRAGVDRPLVPMKQSTYGGVFTDDVLFGGPGVTSGSHGLVSTASDYMKFARMLLHEGHCESGVQLLGPRTVQFMCMNHLPDNSDLQALGGAGFAESALAGTGFGLGMSVCLDPAKRGVLSSVGEVGWGGIAGTYFW